MKAYLQRLNPAKDIIWYYSLQIQRDLFGHWRVLREWGKAGSPGTLRAEPFSCYEDALLSFQSWRTELVQKGYQVVMQEGLSPAMAKSIAAEGEPNEDSS
ncbi:MAG: WGR domain-containing protein [Magnetococcales bacterium]|nr:WGR domain-containing protein [Magnetococcales bacterium]